MIHKLQYSYEWNNSDLILTPKYRLVEMLIREDYKNRKTN